jgi:SMODS-associated and fused to various effectors sensor domain
MKNSSFRDKDQAFWSMERTHLERMFAEQVSPRLRDGLINHLSVFAVAPQPLLTLLGSLMSDLSHAEIYQLHREPCTWRWQPDENGLGYTVKRPSSFSGTPVLILALSASIAIDRIKSVLQEPISPWVVTIENPNNDFLQAKHQLSEFRKLMRGLFNEIKEKHGEDAKIHVFPAAPVSIAVELGRVLMPKADLPLCLYDQNNQLGGFGFAFEINSRGCET